MSRDQESSIRIPVVGVIGSGTKSHDELAEPLGRWLATQPVHLLTGGGGGAMASVCKAFVGVSGRRGATIGIVPNDPGGDPEGGSAKPGYPNPWVEITIRTHLPLTGERGTEPLSRNHINVLSSDVIVALPGGAGTASEVTLAVRYGRPIVAFLESDDQIPGPRPVVPVESDLAGVRAFLIEVLGLTEIFGGTGL